jgi:D-glycerate 3-kinase
VAKLAGLNPVTNEIDPTHIPQWQRNLLQRHQLEFDYLASMERWLLPIVQFIAEQQRNAGRPLLIALNGCQGSGKTTLSDYLCSSLSEEFKLRAIAISLDDFYLTRPERETLAASVHPLLATRGVPGTHDVNLLQNTLEQLLNPLRTTAVTIPRFDKANDDRQAGTEQVPVSEPVHIVVLEGWCLGATPQPMETLLRPVNDLERLEDSEGLWRRYSNESLSRNFLPLYSLVDQWMMLQAPSFDSVFDWRREQELKLARTLPPEQANRLMNDDALRNFIQYYERFTLECLEQLPSRVNHLFTLNNQRQITGYAHRDTSDFAS